MAMAAVASLVLWRQVEFVAELTYSFAHPYGRSHTQPPARTHTHARTQTHSVDLFALLYLPDCYHRIPGVHSGRDQLRHQVEVPGIPTHAPRVGVLGRGGREVHRTDYPHSDQSLVSCPCTHTPHTGVALCFCLDNVARPQVRPTQEAIAQVLCFKCVGG